MLPWYPIITKQYISNYRGSIVHHAVLCMKQCWRSWMVWSLGVKSQLLWWMATTLMGPKCTRTPCWEWRKSGHEAGFFATHVQGDPLTWLWMEALLCSVCWRKKSCMTLAAAFMWSLITAIDKDHLQLYINWATFAGSLNWRTKFWMDTSKWLLFIHLSKRLGHAPPWEFVGSWHSSLVF